MPDRIGFVGRVPNPQVQRYSGLIDVLAYPRRSMRLTVLLTPLQAIAQGRIFVVSEVLGHKELSRDGDAGFPLPAGDAVALARTIDAVLARPDWARVRAAGRRFVESERTWTGSVAHHADLYARALARGAGT